VESATAQPSSRLAGRGAGGTRGAAVAELSPLTGDVAVRVKRAVGGGTARERAIVRAHSLPFRLSPQRLGSREM
jgi:hypothetical protein